MIITDSKLKKLVSRIKDLKINVDEIKEKAIDSKSELRGEIVLISQKQDLLLQETQKLKTDITDLQGRVTIMEKLKSALFEK
jgi:FtsZ-binding cell division protein ZapB